MEKCVDMRCSVRGKDCVGFGSTGLKTLAKKAMSLIAMIITSKFFKEKGDTEPNE